jgi:hypothetical protein
MCVNSIHCYNTLASAVQYVSNLTRHMKNDIEKNLHIKAGIDYFITLLNTYFQALPSYNQIVQSSKFTT